MKTTKKAFSLIEVSFVLALIAMISTFAIDAMAQTQETVKSVTTLSVPEIEAQNALDFIAKEGYNNANLTVTADYISNLESRITINPFNCENGGIAHVITIQEKGSDYIQSFNNCEFNNQFNFLVAAAN
jgi:prepilin-type N-terminal cleavage/methylation domain-containing protein